MTLSTVARLRQWIDQLFPERHIYMRSGGETRGYVLTTGRQLLLAAVVLALLGWTVGVSATLLYGAAVTSEADKRMAMVRAEAERVVADREARLNAYKSSLNDAVGSIDSLAKTIESRHAALGLVMEQFKGVPGAAAALAPTQIDTNRPPMERVLAVRADQERMVSKAESFAKSRAERLRLAFRLAGLDPAGYSGSGRGGMGGPLVEAADPRALAAVLDVDQSFAERIHSATRNLGDMRALQGAADHLPFSRPTTDTQTTSGFGVRFDPFTGRPALHSGLDFAGPYQTPIHATAPGVISFTGVRTGYGNTIEIDHGGGFKTRYAHLASIGVQVGQRVAVGQRIGAMGSTGRSTGVHLHYEVWVGGRAQNPARFVKAGDYVQQN